MSGSQQRYTKSTQVFLPMAFSRGREDPAVKCEEVNVEGEGC